MDGQHLEFMDHHALLALDRCAGQRGVRLTLCTPRGTVAKIAEAIGLRHLRVHLLR